MKKNILSNAPNQIFNALKSYGLTLVFMIFAFNLTLAQDEHANENATVYGGDITFIDGETYNSVCVGDGEADYVEVLIENASGRVKQWIITNEEGDILELPDNPSDINFDDAEVGICLIYHLSYNGIKPLVDPSGQGKFTKNINDIVGRFHLSEPIMVERFLQPTAGVLEGGPFEFCVGDGEADNIPEGAITLSGNMGTNSAWVVTDEAANILALPASPYDVNFDEAPAGTCLVWHLSYEDNVSFDGVTNASELMGCYALSNPITVNRYAQPTAGVLEGGPFEFCVGDGEADFIPEGAITLSGNMGTNSAWVVTDEAANILALPASPYDVNFDEAPAGTCLVWHLSYEDNVSFDGVTNASELMGCYALSNPITVNRYAQPTAGVLEGVPFEFCVGDGEADFIPEGAITLSGNMGTNSAWVVTDEAANILALPASPYDVNFDEAPAGTCLVWHLSYEDNVSFDGVTNASELMGCYALSNAVTVVREHTEGGTLDGGPFEFIVGDGVADNIPDAAITLTENEGTNSQWVITNDDGTVILALPTNSYTEVDFDTAPAGTSLVWHLSYEDGLEGLAVDAMVADLVGCFSFSNSVSVVKTATSAGLIWIIPNPSGNTTNLDLSNFKSDDVTISIHNLLNARVFNRAYDLRSSNSRIISINVSSYNEGLYFVRVTDNNTGKNYIKRLIVN